MRHLGPMLVLALVLGACGTAAPAASVPAPASPLLTAPAPSTVPALGGSPAVAAPLAAFLGMTLTDVRSGEKFTLADHKGKVTIVEGMAVW